MQQRRYELDDRQWGLIEGLFPRGSRGRPWRDHRQVVNGVLWVLFAGAPWRDLPGRYGPWQTAHRRLVRWRRDGTWERVLARLRLRADQAGLLDWSQWDLDGTVVRASRAAAGAARQKGGGRPPTRTSRPTTRWAAAAAGSGPRSTWRPRAGGGRSGSC